MFAFINVKVYCSVCIFYIALSGCSSLTRISPVLFSGQVIVDKNPGITCVVNKTNIIDSTYRNFQMEVLAGESNLVTKVQDFSPLTLNFIC